MSGLIDQSPRQLGGFSIGPLAFGCWRLVAMSPDAAQSRIETALEHGLNLVDTADVYGLDWGGAGFGDAEQLLGQVLQQAPHLREQLVLATKGGIVPGVPYDCAQLKQACDASLQRLGVEQIDLYQIHRPDMLTHPEEVARSLEDLIASGKVLEVGVSNFTCHQVDALAAYLDRPLVSHQPEYSALHLDPLFDGVFDQCMSRAMNVLVWSPLAGGRLTSPQNLNRKLLDIMTTLAQREAVDLSTLALAFALAHPARPVAIVGSTNIERIGQSVHALKVHLDRTDVYAIIQASRGEALP